MQLFFSGIHRSVSTLLYSAFEICFCNSLDAQISIYYQRTHKYTKIQLHFRGISVQQQQQPSHRQRFEFRSQCMECGTKKSNYVSKLYVQCTIAMFNAQ